MFDIHRTRITKCDYVRFTSWCKDDFDVVRTELVSLGYLTLIWDQKTMGYRGRSGVNWFYGTKAQKRNGILRPHHILQISGKGADEIMQKLYRLNLKASRLDLSLDIKNESVDYEQLFFLLKEKGFKTVLYKSTNCTLYIGSRSSETYIRVYEHKFSDDSISDRFEIEYKGRRAQFVKDNFEKRDRFVLAELLRVCKKIGNDELLLPFIKALQGCVPVAVRIPKEEKGDSLKFYFNVIRSYLWRHFASKETRDFIKDDILQIYQQNEMFTEAKLSLEQKEGRILNHRKDSLDKEDLI